MYPERRFRHLIDLFPVPIWCVDDQGKWTFFNKLWLDFTGRSMAQSTGRGWLADVHPDDAGQTASRIADHVAHREGFRLEFRLRRHDGVWRDMLSSGVPRQDASGAFSGFIGSCTDLTDIREFEAQQKRDLDEKAAVMQELHHRVKNNAQVFASLLSVQASRATDPAVKAALRVAASRASTMAFAQQQIWDAGSSARFDLGALVRRLVRAQQVRGIEVTVDAPEMLFVPLATAVPLGLIVHELLTNAHAHAYPVGGTGRIGIKLQRDNRANLLVEIADDGIGLPESANLESGRSAGLTIVRSLARQLGARLEAEIGGGTKVSLILSCPAPQ